MKNLIILALMLFTTISFAQKERTLELNKDTNLIDVVYYHDNGVISQTGSYTQDGKLHGEWLSFNMEGQKMAVAKYEQGKKVGTWFYYENELLREVNYNSNKIAKVVTWKDSETKVVSNF